MVREGRSRATDSLDVKPALRRNVSDSELDGEEGLTQGVRGGGVKKSGKAEVCLFSAKIEAELASATGEDRERLYPSLGLNQRTRPADPAGYRRSARAYSRRGSRKSAWTIHVATPRPDRRGDSH